MKKIKKCLLTIFIICSLSACAQNITRAHDNSRDLQILVFNRVKPSQSNIHIEKAIFKESIDDSGWIKRIQENLFGFPNFDKEVIEKINREIESRTKDTAVSYDDLFHEITTEKVEKFFTREDRAYIEKQIKAAKREKWDQSNYSYSFIDSLPAIKISEPYYNRDKNKALVFILSPTQEKAEFYHKVDGKWNFYFSSLLWIE